MAMEKNVRQITIGGHLVGIIGLDEILAEVPQMQLKDEAELKAALLAKAKTG